MHLFPIYIRQGRNARKFKTGYIDQTGQTIVPPVYDYGQPFYNGFASVQLGDLWGTIDTKGELVIIPKFSRSLTFTAGLSEFSIPGDRRGLIDTKGNVVVPPRYGYVTHFSNGLACFRDKTLYEAKSLYGFLDTKGNQVIPPFFEDARPFSEGLAAVKMNGKWGYIHPDGSIAIAMQFVCERGMAGPFRQGRGRVAKDGKWGHIDAQGQFITPPIYDMALEFSEGLAPIEIKKLRGFVNLAGDLAIPANYENVDSFSCGLARAKVPATKPRDPKKLPHNVGFLDTKGNFAISPAFFSAGRFRHGLCLVETQRTIAYIALTGEFVWSSPVVAIGNFDPHHLLPPEICVRATTALS